MLAGDAAAVRAGIEPFRYGTSTSSKMALPPGSWTRPANFAVLYGRFAAVSVITVAPPYATVSPCGSTVSTCLLPFTADTTADPRASRLPLVRSYRKVADFRAGLVVDLKCEQDGAVAYL